MQIFRILMGVVMDFIEHGATQSEHYFYHDDFFASDFVDLPEGRVVKVTFEYINEEDA